MRNALERHHVPVEWIALDDSGGSVAAREESLYRYYDAVEQFLRKYNPPD